MNTTTPVASTIRDGDRATIHIAGYISTDAADPLETAFQQASECIDISNTCVKATRSRLEAAGGGKEGAWRGLGRGRGRTREPGRDSGRG